MSVFGVILILRIQSKCGKMRTRITPKTDTFFALYWVLNLLIASSGLTFFVNALLIERRETFLDVRTAKETFFTFLSCRVYILIRCDCSVFCSSNYYFCKTFLLLLNIYLLFFYLLWIFFLIVANFLIFVTFLITADFFVAVVNLFLIVVTCFKWCRYF